MKALLLASLLVWVVTPACRTFAQAAQSPDTPVVGGVRQQAQIVIMPVYQSFTFEGVQQEGGNPAEEVEISELSTVVTASAPLGRNLAAGLRMYGAFATGDPFGSLEGFADVQLSLSYRQPVGSGSLVLGTGVNLPSGKTGLSQNEFDLLRLISNNLYGFNVPSLGQGLGISPSATLAIPLSRRVVFGVGVSYQYRGAYEPLQGTSEAYDAGDELLLTGGLDIGLTRSLVFSADVSYAAYGTDRFGEQEVFQAGRKLVSSAQLRHTRGWKELWLFAQYRQRGKNSLPDLTGNGFEEEDTRTTRNEFRSEGRYRFRVGRMLEMAFLGELRSFEAIPGFEAATVFGGGIAPALRLGADATVPLRVVYYTGDLSGIEAGLGLALRL